MKLKSMIAGIITMVALVAGSALGATFNNPQLGVSVNVPVTLNLVAGDPSRGTTHAGQAYTQYIYTGAQPNEDSYIVGVHVYDNLVPNYDDLGRAINGFAGAVNGTVSNVTEVTVSGQPAKTAYITLPADKNGRVLRFGYLVSYKGNRLYQFAFGTYLDTQSNMDEVLEFFKSASIN
jgi:hypothetical protein